MVKRLAIIAATLAALCSSAHADGLANNPGIFPSASFTTGNCLQATGENSAATIAGPCGTATGNGNVTGPTSSTIGDIAVFSNGTGTGIADSHVMAASIPFLGADNTWGGLDTFLQRPVFNGQTPYDTGNLPGALAPYLLSATAASTYLSQTSAAATYETITAAAATYATLTQLATKAPINNPTFTGVATAPAYTLVAPAGTWKPISFNSGGFQRWQLGSNNAGEGGSNTGSDFDVYAYADNGSIVANVLHIQRSTGVASFSARPIWGFTPYDTGNLPAALAPYLLSATAATTYLPLTGGTINGNLNVTGSATGVTLPATDDSTNFATTAHVKAELSTYLTIASAASTYLTQTAAQQTYATISGVQSAYLRITDAANTYLTIANAAGTYLTAAQLTTALAPYETSAHSAATYLPLAGGTVTGPVQFNQIPVLNASIPPVTDSSGDVASSSWVQAVITSRVGTNGPYIPLTGVGMPYDISFPYIGLSIPQTPYPTAFNVLTYTFARKVAFPTNFGSSHVTCINLPTNMTALTVSRTGSVAGVIGSLTFAPGGKCAGLFSGVSAQTFLPGDTLTIFTNESASNPAIADPTLGGIGGTIPGTISN